MQNNPIFTEPIIENTQRLVSRVDELEDLVIELKSKQSASELTNLKDVISQQQQENAYLVKKIGILSEKRINCKDMFQSNDMH